MIANLMIKLEIGTMPCYNYLEISCRHPFALYPGMGKFQNKTIVLIFVPKVIN